MSIVYFLNEHWPFVCAALIVGGILFAVALWSANRPLENDAQLAERIINAELLKHASPHKGGPLPTRKEFCKEDCVCERSFSAPVCVDPAALPVAPWMRLIPCGCVEECGDRNLNETLTCKESINPNHFKQKTPLKLDPANLRNALNVVYKDRLQSTVDRLNVGNIATLLSTDTDGPRNPAQEAADDAAYVAKLARNAGVKSERMYADSGHQVVNPEVMKRVLNEQFGDLNPEQGQWTEARFVTWLRSCGASVHRGGHETTVYIDDAAWQKLINNANTLLS